MCIVLVPEKAKFIFLLAAQLCKCLRHCRETFLTRPSSEHWAQLEYVLHFGFKKPSVACCMHCMSNFFFIFYFSIFLRKEIYFFYFTDTWQISLSPSQKVGNKQWHHLKQRTWLDYQVSLVRISVLVT